jgi:energy-coupling factor transport system ATP-binding protein
MSIELKDVHYIYSPGNAYEIEALKGINLTIGENEFIGLVGHTGSGKSTLIQHLNGLIKPTSGQILVNGEDICAKGYDLRSLRFKVGLVFQYPEYQLFETAVLADVCYGPMNQGYSKEKAESLAIEALQAVGLSEEFYERSPFDMSGGQRRRVAIAGVLAMKPQVLILDEPTAGLDPYGRTEILELVKFLHEQQKITILLVSHSMEDMAEYAKRLIVMNDGNVLFDDAPKKVFMHHKELEEIGLAAPQVSYLMQDLIAHGLNVPDNCITVEEAKEAILTAVKAKE